jgi:uncharacterized membrane protein YsdA (DUF1294 family)
MFQAPFLYLIVAVNCVALIIFGADKLKSKKGSWRIPESRLLFVAFLGPFGAFAGMLLFRHKTRKLKFILVPLFLFLQALLVVYFFKA